VDPDTEPPDQAALDRLRDAKNRLLMSREAAVTAGSSRYFSEDWEATEAGSPTGEPETGTLGDVKAALAAYNAAVGAYEALAEKSRPLYAADMEAALDKARAGAVEAGAPDQWPDPFLAADGAFEEAAAHYEAGEYEAAVSSARLALGIYGMLEISIKSFKIRQEIEDRDFVKYDPVNFDFAGEIYDAAWADYDAGSMEDAREKAEVALVWYGLVLDVGWESFASEWGTAVALRQQEAIDLKANVAAREEYEEAVEIFKQGDLAFYERRFDEAVSLYTLADAQFQNSGHTAEEKRLLAEDAIQEAQERVSRSGDTARDAELLMEGGTQ
jgi:tetratricopeptide (TPR) repeat protein